MSGAVQHSSDKIFMSLVGTVVPHGYEVQQYGELLGELGFTRYSWGFHAEVGSSDVAFMAHLDQRTNEYTQVPVIVSEDWVYSLGNNILGADNLAGVAVLLYMYAHRVPGQYHLFFGEEDGGIGSHELASQMALSGDTFDLAVSFDRRGTQSLVTHQMGTRMCSSELEDALIQAFEDEGIMLHPDPTGVFTDCASFFDEGVTVQSVNISVGYENEHTSRERQNLAYLRELGEATVRIFWDALPVVPPPVPMMDVEDMLYHLSYNDLLMVLITIAEWHPQLVESAIRRTEHETRISMFSM